MHSAKITSGMNIDTTGKSKAFSVRQKSSMLQATQTSNSNSNSNVSNTSKEQYQNGNKNRMNDRILRGKMLQDKWRKQLNRFVALLEKDESPPSRTCNNLMALSAAANQWTTYGMVLDTMEKINLSVGKSTYRNILKECYSNGNGVASLKVLENMKSDPLIKTDQEDLRLAIIALCRNNKYEPGLWTKALQLIHVAAAAIENGEVDGDAIGVDAYNDILQCIGEEKRWEDALELLGVMEEGSGFHALPNLATYDRVLNALISSSQTEAAVDLLLSMSEHQSALPTIYSYETVLSALLRKRGRVNWKLAIELLDSMQKLKIVAPTILFNRVISACAKARELEAASGVFYKMKAQNVAPDTVTYNALITAAANTGRSNAALRLLEMCENDTGADVITYTNTIRACAKGRMSKKSMQLLKDAKEKKMPLDAFIYTATIDACAKAHEYEDALDLLSDMKNNNVLPNEYTYSSVITACGNCGQWKKALDLLDTMKKNGMKVSTITYNSVISALSKGARQSIKGASDTKTDPQNLWIKALELLEEMKSKRVWPDMYTYSGVLSCCASGGRYKEALDLIKTMQNGPPRVRPNKIAYTGAIYACARSGEWSHALRLFVDMKVDRVRYDLVTYNALAAAFSNGGQPDLAFELWNDMCGKGSGQFSAGAEDLSPDIITLETVIGCLVEGGENKAMMDSVFKDAVEMQIVLPSDSMDTKWEIDLSGMSLPVARAACRYIIKRLDNIDTQDLSLITGIGMHHHDNSKYGSTTLKECVKEVLQEDFYPSLLSELTERAPGVVFVEKHSLQAWLEKPGIVKE